MERRQPFGCPFQLAAHFSYNEDILTHLGSLFSYYTEKHGKVLVVRFDISYPVHHEVTSIQTDISRCIQKIAQKYKRQGYDPAYMWVREQQNSIHPHYHCVLLLNGNRVRSYNHVFQTAESLWGSTIGADASGLVHHCTVSKHGTPHENGIMLRRCDSDYAERCQQVQQQVSYLAKSGGKGEPHDGMRDFGMSRIPHKPQE